jgi:predicted translin family RNA/ssDNA-binding protein
MKKTMLIAMSLSAVIAFTTTPTQAQAASAAGGGHSHFTKILATVEEIWREIHKQQGKLVAVVAAKDLGEAHDHAFAIRDLVKALPAKVSAENKAKAEAGAKEITKLAADIDKSGAAGAQKATEANVKKIGEAVRDLEGKLKPVAVTK